MTPNEIFSFSAQGARYSGPYMGNSGDNKSEIAAIIQYHTTFNSNQLTRNYNDELLVVNSYRDQSITNQKIGEVLFHSAPKTPNNIAIVNTLNRLPASISTFDSTASCKILTARTTNIDYIEYVDMLSGQRNSYAGMKMPLNNPIRGSWFSNDPIRWSVEKRTNEAGISRAVINYDDGTYEDAIYVRKNTLTVSPNEQQRCEIYNEAAKNQILEALSKVTLPSQ